MLFALTGASGFIGSALTRALVADGHVVRRLVRRRGAAGDGAVYWNPATGEIDAAGLEGVDAVVHLAGANIATYWTRANKRRILESRVQGTRLLASALAALRRPPSVLVCASGVGFYGDRGDEVLDESKGSGSDFLAGVAREWEGAADPARAAGIRVVHTRFGLVLSRHGGALPKILLPFRFGVGGRLGSGRQWMSWIALADVVRVLRFAADTPTLAGPVNAVSPNPVTNAEFTRTLARVLHRPALFPVPAFALRLLLGEMGQGTLLVSQRAVPRKLAEAGFVFGYGELERAVEGE